LQNDQRIVHPEIVEHAAQAGAMSDLHTRDHLGKYPSAAHPGERADLRVKV
jgi:hypothetical protein